MKRRDSTTTMINGVSSLKFEGAISQKSPKEEILKAKEALNDVSPKPRGSINEDSKLFDL